MKDFGKVIYQRDTQAYVIDGGSRMVFCPNVAAVPAWLRERDAELWADVDGYAALHPDNVETVHNPTAKEEELLSEIATRQAWLSAHDYIGTKIATGRATAAEYADTIAEMTRIADEVDALQKELAYLGGTV